MDAFARLSVLGGVRDVGVLRYVLSTGSAMMDQFEPWYLGVAFAFCFAYCAGMPDVGRPGALRRHRRQEGHPEVPLPVWVRVMTRRVEQQLRRDWLLGFTMSSVLFQSALNMSRIVYMFESEKRENAEQGYSPGELEKAAIEVCEALHT